MTYRKQTICFAAILAGFLLANFVIWKIYTEELLSNRHDGGDMTRLGYVTGSKVLRNTYVDLPKQHIEMSDFHGQKIDVLTIGDSFSAGQGFGKNPYYQDFIASSNNFTVLNADPYLTDDLYMCFQPLSTLAVLYNSGFLDIIKPRYVLIESVARYSVQRFAQAFNFSRTEPLEKVKEYYRHKKKLNEAPSVFFVNNGNFKFILNRLLYRYSDSAFADTIHVRKLRQPFFSVKNADSLLFLHEDLKYMREVTPQSIELLNDNFNRIADLLKKKGIQLLYMPIVDKYDLYSDYIVNNPYPKSFFFEELRKQHRRYILIDTKDILSNYLKKKEKDLYFPDDSHWSWKASKYIFETVKFD
ncbi:MAG: hypothetical protein HXX11_01955 [Desulfuromonadales bacterium]|nr:hypothetical protein [Desulfuromonadales bacterium]